MMRRSEHGWAVFSRIIQTISDDISLADLLTAINSLCNSPLDNLHISLQRAIRNWGLMMEVTKTLEDANHKVCWGVVKFHWKQGERTVVPDLTAQMEKPDFYHFLSPDISVGISDKPNLIMIALNCNARDDSRKIGIRRGLDVTKDEWQKMYPNTNNEWWMKQCDVGDEQACQIAQRIIALLAG